MKRFTEQSLTVNLAHGGAPAADDAVTLPPVNEPVGRSGRGPGAVAAPGVDSNPGEDEQRVAGQQTSRYVMSLTAELTLAPDVQFVPGTALPDAVQARLPTNAPPGFRVLSRERARSGSRIIDHHGHRLLNHFHQPRRVVDAVIAYAAQSGLNPSDVLEDCQGLIVTLKDAPLR